MKLSLFSVSYSGLWGQSKLDLIQFIQKAAELGYDSVMVMGKRPHLSPLDANAEQMERIQRALRTHGIECAAIGAYVDLSVVGAAEVPYQEMQIAYVDSLARLGSQLGSKIIRVFTGYEQLGVSTQVSWQGAVTVLKEACDRVSGYGATIAIQNHHDIAVDSNALLELLNDIDKPNCRLGFDAWSPALRGEPLYEAARTMAPYTVITTNADYVRFPRFRYEPALVNYSRVLPDMVRAVRFGEGFIDYDAFFQGLRDGGFDGIATYEMCSPLRGGGDLDNLDAHARSYLEWMRSRRVVRTMPPERPS